MLGHRPTIFIIALLALVSGLQAAEITLCRSAWDTDPDLQAAGYRWDFYTSLTNVTINPRPTANVDTYVALHDGNDPEVLDMNAMIPRKGSSPHEIMSLTIGSITDIKTLKAEAAAFRLQFVLDSVSSEGGLKRNYLVQTSASCQTDMNDFGTTSDHVLGIVVQRLVKAV